MSCDVAMMTMMLMVIFIITANVQVPLSDHQQNSRAYSSSAFSNLESRCIHQHG